MKLRFPVPSFLRRILQKIPDWYLAVFLFFVTLFTTTVMGSLLEMTNPFESWYDFSQGFFFSVPLLLILFAHEMGHYLMCRRHGIPATPPFFIPFFLMPGTLGAFIRIKGLIPDRRILLEVGAGGPLAGILVAFPIYAVGLVTSPHFPLSVLEGDVIYFGEPLLSKLISFLFLTDIPENHFIYWNSVAFAGWIGMLVTMLNLLPAGQLDGGHIMYALFRKHHERIARIMTITIVCLGIFWPGWIIWSIFIVKIAKLKHPPTFFDSVPLTPAHRRIGYAGILTFILVFIPAPVTFSWWTDNLGMLYHFASNLL